METTLNNIKDNALETLKKARSLEELKDIEVKYLGRKGELTLILKGVKDLPPDQKPTIGKLSHTVKISLEQAFDQKRIELENKQIEDQLSTEFFDTTIPGISHKKGSIHPITQVQEEVEHIFGQMGFAIQDGPEVESEYFNFEGLNIPKDHPARDMQDTFFMATDPHKDQGHMVLRTHTSPVQIRTMQKYGAPLRIVVPGRVFRNEATDASHDTTFYQVEGMLIDKDISLAHLKGILKEFLSRLFKKEVTVRFRPGYFPFVEPGLEVDFSCLICQGKGCRVCKHTGWVEFMGAGMIHENVLKAGGIDPKEYQGWAFGFGLTRLVMMRYEIDDIRLLSGGDLRFLKQF